ncbi:MAG: AAA family ATPase [Trueperaceae bacterium]|nr:AAA family ATPase [Trueperaceae bacterium]
MARSERLSATSLERSTPPERFAFETTAELEPSAQPVGQPRAVAAVRFGVAMADHGYNVFALGPNGTGKRHFIADFLAREAAQRPAPPDLAYVHDFAEPSRPRALTLPPGRAIALRDDMLRLVEEVAVALPAAFEADEYQTRLQAIEEDFKRRTAGRLESLRERAAAQQVAMVQTPEGMAFAPLRDGEVVGPEAFARLPEDDRQRLQRDIGGLQRELQAVLRELPRVRREHRTRVRELHERISAAAIGDPIDETAARYADVDGVPEYLEGVRRDLIANARDVIRLREHQESDPFAGTQPRAAGELPFWRRYRVNVLVDRTGAEGAPVVFEDHPTHQNLVGRIDHVPQQGALVTDFMLLRPGALHRANGGYLVLEALKLLQQPFAWDALKRALRSGRLHTEPPGQSLGLLSTVTLEPEPVPLAVKVVLLGDRQLYYLLTALDPDMLDLFKVAADFDDVIDRTPESEVAYASLIAAIGHSHDLRAFDRGAVARVFDAAARHAGDTARLSANTGALADVLREADHWAGVAGREVVAAEDVQRAIDQQTFRADRIQARLREAMLRDTLHVETDGERVGQVNGLSVFELASHRFGRPSRITARVRIGRGDVLDIEREVALGGPVHSKGVLILTSLLAARFAAERPLSLSASLVFEQSYGGVEGDSASVAEFVALLSAIAEVPVRQALAVTGAVDQFGRAQPIGGVNEKVEGFFDLCAARGLTGDHGVLVPETNVPHLLLKREVVDAVRDGRFHVYPIADVDQAAELLTGLPVGAPGPDGRCPPGSIGARVQARLERLAQAWAEAVRRGGASPD